METNSHLLDETEVVSNSEIQQVLIKDSATALLDRSKAREYKERALRDQTAAERSRIAKEKAEEAIRKYLGLILVPFLPKTWIKVLQFYEEFTLAALLCGSIVSMLLSIIGIIYITINLNLDNFSVSLGKFLGCVLLFVLGLTIQIKNEQPNRKRES